MGKIHEEKTYGFKLRESANDGSDFTNPEADYRIVFLGEDGEWHSRDSAGSIAGFAGSGISNTLADAAGDILVASAADTWAKLAIGSAGGFVSRINGVVAWNSGTSNPGAAAAGDRFWRTDLGLEIYFDGTRWLTTKLYHMVFPRNAGLGASATSEISFGSGLGGSYDIWIEDILFNSVVATTNNGTNNWTCEVYKSNVGVGTDTSIASRSTSADTADVKKQAIVAVDALAGSNSVWFYTFVTKVLAPGNIRIAAIMTYRLVIT